MSVVNFIISQGTAVFVVFIELLFGICGIIMGAHSLIYAAETTAEIAILSAGITILATFLSFFLSRRKSKTTFTSDNITKLLE